MEATRDDAISTIVTLLKLCHNLDTEVGNFRAARVGVPSAIVSEMESEVRDTRQKIIDIVTYASATYQLFMNQSVGDIILGDCAMSVDDFNLLGDYTFEQFLEMCTTSAFDAGNELIMYQWMSDMVTTANHAFN